MTLPQVTLGSTDTMPRRFGSVLYDQDAVPTLADDVVLNTPQYPLPSTNADSADFWRRLGARHDGGIQTPDPISSVDIQRPWRLLQPAFFSLVLPLEPTGPVATSADAKMAADLDASLRDLEDATEEAREECFPEPSQLALDNAELLLRDLYRLRPCRLETYPTPDGEIALVVPGPRGRSMLVLCDSDGGVLCSVNLNGQHRRARYSDVATLPDGFIREALSDLDDTGRAL